jgi:hypothetical protein
MLCLFLFDGWRLQARSGIRLSLIFVDQIFTFAAASREATDKLPR